MGAGLLVTVVLDFLLIPPFGANGAAIASAAAYLTTTLALLWFFWRVRQSELSPAYRAATLSRAEAK
jgi:Na+-driven multidrug efflux pump